MSSHVVSDRLWNRGVISVVNAQFFSALADNALFFALLEFLKVFEYGRESTYILQGTFVVFYILLAPMVGLLADNQPKARVLMVGNGIKLIGVLLLFANINPYICYGIVGLGAAIYSPAKFGILSELVTPRLLIKVNGVVEGSTILAILLGTFLGGMIAKESVLFAFVFCAVVYAIAVIFNIYIPKIKATRKDDFKPSALLKSFISIIKVLSMDKRARFAILGTSMFWGAASTLRLLLNDWVRDVLHQGTEVVAKLSAVVSIGIVAGAIIASLFITQRNMKLCLWSGLGMGVILVLFSFQTNIYAIIMLLIIVGALGGIFVIPLNAMLQERGKIFNGTGTAVAVQNFSENLVMLSMMLLFGFLVSLKVISVITLMITFGVIFCCGIGGLFYHIRKRDVFAVEE